MEGVTRRLLVVRHASTLPAAHGESDFDRRLDAKGEHQLGSLRAGFDELADPVDAVLASTATRVRETVAGLLSPGFDESKIEWSTSLYLAGAGTLLEVLRELPSEYERVALCGHNPGVHQLVLDLANDEPPHELTKGFPTGAMAAFDLDVSWSELAPSTALLVEFRSPPKRHH
jgi:phosphohistidine phosphatase